MENAEDIERQVLQDVENGAIIRLMEHEAQRRFGRTSGGGSFGCSAQGAGHKEGEADPRRHLQC